MVKKPIKRGPSKALTTWIIIILLLLIIQTMLIFLIGFKLTQIPGQINSTEYQLNKKIELNNAEINSKIKELSNNLIEIESDFSEEINYIKAESGSDFSGIINLAVKSIVSIQTDLAQGTGFIISPKGYVITNAHVLAGARYATAITSEREAKDMEFIGYNSLLDLALLKIDGTLPHLELGNSNEIKVGEKVIAIGNPLGLSFSVSEGIISGVNRKGANQIPAYIQTDAALNPGNSGGPLINSKGQAIGINNFKLVGESLGFALESNYIKEAVNMIASENLNQTIIS